jgi:transposase
MAASRRIVVGVDTHADSHTAAVCDDVGRMVAFAEFPADRGGYRALLGWARRHGEIVGFGVEGTGSYGAGLSRYLSEHGARVVEINRVNRQHRRRHGKSDPFDAEAAARAVLSGEATAIPKQRIGAVEAVRALMIARQSAVKATTQAANQIRDLIVTAPDDVRAELVGLSTEERVRRCARWRPGSPVDARSAVRSALCRLAKRWLSLHDEARELDRQMRSLLEQLVPSLMAETGVSTQVAARLVVAVGENPERLRSEASFAALCGTSPVIASSGKTNRHRLSRGGNRQANSALHIVVLIRSQRCDETRRYLEKRRAEGKTQRETWRCLKRALARRFHHLIITDLTPSLT